MSTDIRWKQRFDNFGKAFLELREAVDLAAARPLSKLEKQGAIQGFEYTHELAWNVLKDYLEYQGIVGLIGSRDTTRAAFQRGLIEMCIRDSRRTALQRCRSPHAAGTLPQPAHSGRGC